MEKSGDLITLLSLWSIPCSASGYEKGPLIGEDISNRDLLLFNGSVLEFTLCKIPADEGEFYFSRYGETIELHGPNGIKMTLATIPEGLELDKPYARNLIMNGGLVITTVSVGVTSIKFSTFKLNEDSFNFFPNLALLYHNYVFYSIAKVI